MLKKKTTDKPDKISNKSVIEANPSLPYIDKKILQEIKKSSADRIQKIEAGQGENNQSEIKINETCVEDNSDSSEQTDGEMENDIDLQKNTWREYFTEEEIQSAFHNISQGKNHVDTEDVESIGSDSISSEDNIEKGEIQEFINNLPITEHPSTIIESKQEETINNTQEEEDYGVENVKVFEQRENALHRVQLQWSPMGKAESKPNVPAKPNLVGGSQNIKNSNRESNRNNSYNAAKKSQRVPEPKNKNVHVSFNNFAENLRGSVFDSAIEQLGEQINFPTNASLCIGRQNNPRKDNRKGKQIKEVRRRQVSGNIKYHQIPKESKAIGGSQPKLPYANQSFKGKEEENVEVAEEQNAASEANCNT